MTKHVEREFDRDNGINTKDFLIGALVGGIVGAVTALLLAPKSGLVFVLTVQSFLLQKSAYFQQNSCRSKCFLHLKLGNYGLWCGSWTNVFVQQQFGRQGTVYGERFY